MEPGAKSLELGAESEDFGAPILLESLVELVKLVLLVLLVEKRFM